jgi:hypothetical protein
MARIQLTPTARFALIALRVYLLVMLVLILVKFVRLFTVTPDRSASAAIPTAPHQTAQLATTPVVPVQ